MAGGDLLKEVIDYAPPADPDQPRTRIKPPNRERPVKGTVVERSIQEIQNQFQEQLDQALSLFSLAMPVTGVYAVENSEKAVGALFNIAKRRPKLLAALTKTADGIDGIQIGQYMLGIGVALQVDLGRMDPHSMPAKVFGVEQVYMEHFEQVEPTYVNPNVTTIDYSSDHPRFSTIG